MDRRNLHRVAGRGATGIGSSRPTYILSPEGATFATGGFPQTTLNNGGTWPDYTLDYSATTAEAAFWYVGIPTGADFNGGQLEVFAKFATAGSGTSLGWTITTRAVGNAQAWTAAGVGSTITAGAIGVTACQVTRRQIALTVSGWSAGKVLQIKIARTTQATGAAVRPRAKFSKALLRLTRDGN
jgi:hypothetical protein